MAEIKPLVVEVRTREVATLELPASMLQARVAAESFDEKAGTVELIWTTGARVVRSDYWTGREWAEELVVDSKSVRMDRLNNGAPLLDSHGTRGGVRDAQIGVVEKAWIDDKAGEGRALVRFSKRENLRDLIGDVKDGIVRNVSVGYRIHRIEETEELDEKGRPVTRATDWEPFELSLVPMGADPKARVRAADEPTKYPCTFVRRGAEPTMTAKTDDKVTEPVADEVRKQAAKEATDAERARSGAILKAVRAAKMADAIALELISSGKSIDEARAFVLEKLAEKDAEGDTRSVTQVGTSDTEKFRDCVSDALMTRAGFKIAKPADGVDEFRYMRIPRLAEFCLQRSGQSTRGMSEQSMCRRAMSTSDLPKILANVQGKTLRRAYEEAPQSFAPFVRRVPVADFKPVSRTQLGATADLLVVPEGGEITEGKVVDTAQGYKLLKYGRIFSYTWEMAVNDDLDALARIPAGWGASARRKETQLVYAVLTGNQTMDEDATALFHANHANAFGGAGAGVLSVASLANARKLMRLQRAPDGTSPASSSAGPILNLRAAILVVPAALEIDARKFLTDIVADQPGNVNPIRGTIDALVSDATLDASSALIWYMTASPAEADVIELASLDDNESVIVDSQQSFETKGIKTSAVVVRAASAIDFRSFVRSTGT